MEAGFQRMSQFCEDLDRWVGRSREDEEGDELTAQIYLLEKNEEALPSWVRKLGPVLADTTEDLGAQGIQNLRKAPEAELSAVRDRVDAYLSPYDVPEEVRAAFCLSLWDYAFSGLKVKDLFNDDLCNMSSCLAPQASGSDFCTQHKTKMLTDLIKAFEDRDEVCAIAHTGTTAVVQREAKSLTDLGKTIRWISILGGGLGALAATTVAGAATIVSLAMCALLASWMLIDKKAIRSQVAAENMTKEDGLRELGNSPPKPSAVCHVCYGQGVGRLPCARCNCVNPR